jgi:hypothetical protein
MAPKGKQTPFKSRAGEGTKEVLKRPSSSIKVRESGVRQEQQRFTQEVFDLCHFVQQLLSAACLQPATDGQRRRLVLATGCSGAGTPSYVLSKLLAQHPEEVIASEQCRKTAFFLMRMVRPQHIFQD